VTFTKVLTMYHSWIYPWTFSLSSPHTPSLPFLEVSTGLIFPFTYMWYSICTVFTLPCPFPHHSPPTDTNTQMGSVLPSLFSIFVKMTFLSVSFPHVRACVYCIPNWFISIFFLSTLVPFLWWFQQVKKFYIHSCIDSTSTIFTFLISFFYTPTSYVTSL
jgi:hypothetical protein